MESIMMLTSPLEYQFDQADDEGRSKEGSAFSPDLAITVHGAIQLKHEQVPRRRTKERDSCCPPTSSHKEGPTGASVSLSQ
ncbi:unnamed protein product [Ambrosiozyma monospora]|uniref:Unnamed protein product n=1 Tax=Ambrosiozyma monospora TaxID=43982 RepID=A0A9W6YSN8_AMBMO|nr:unnamed protein product [Ambrosiozyma monospora]